jgi:osmotically-inducible protein OsmY
MQTITKKTDATLKTDVLAELNYEPSVTVTDIGVLVKDGTVTLNGYATNYREKWEAVRAVKRVAVKGVSNFIEIVPKLKAAEIETNIQSAFKRSAMLDAKHIRVETAGNKVILRGDVRNYEEREEAERVAWAAPGVLSVANHLEVKWPFFGE